jgi:hypothetical protein
MPSIPVKNFGKHSDQVSALGLGGHHLGDAQDEQTAVQRERCRAFAADGRYERFKTTKFYDGDLGRQQHGYPTAKELPF